MFQNEISCALSIIGISCCVNHKTSVVSFILRIIENPELGGITNEKCFICTLMFDVYKNLESLLFEQESYIKYDIVES